MKFRIETSNLILRTFEMTDANDYFNMVQDSEIRKYTDGAYIDNLSETEFYFKTIYTKADLKNDFYIAIEEKESHKLIGGIIAVRNCENLYEASYFISKEFRRKGYMKEALQGFLENIPLFISGCIVFDIHQSNVASLEVIKTVVNIEDSLTEPYEQKKRFYYHVK